ncbi:MAG: hypothetical protein P1U87_07865 [Verrucomicrobiales bacterium]|nr:hypothetical protein [Verrucomicrobiales bacterium]
MNVISTGAMHLPSANKNIETARRIHAALPQGGLFAEKAWRISPEPFALSKKEVKALEKLGPLLLRFQKACDMIYRRSRNGSLPGWISEYLDQGKPESLLELGLATPVVEKTPRVIRPDLILTESGFTATELDSVPGGIGLTAWLEEIYSRENPHAALVGGDHGMLDGFASVFSEAGADILVSEESADYRPEMEWLSGKLDGDWGVFDAESYQPNGRDVYRFFELFDLPNLPGAEAVGKAVAAGEIDIASPFKPWMEEKLWSALFWSHPLKEVWRRELRDGNWRRLQELFPMSWVVDPAEVPHHAVIPELGIQHFSEMKQFSQTERDLVLKLSGFNERAWGSKSVTIGQDVSQEDWGAAVDEAIEGYSSTPYVLQRFHSGKLVSHPWFNPETGEMEIMEGRVRLCPYYFVSATGSSVSLGGVLATICPSDKKVLHGMSDAILVPCSIER